MWPEKARAAFQMDLKAPLSQLLAGKRLSLPCDRHLGKPVRRSTCHVVHVAPEGVCFSWPHQQLLEHLQSDECRWRTGLCLPEVKGTEQHVQVSEGGQVVLWANPMGHASE